MKKILALLAVLLLSGCAATFDQRVKNTQDEIDTAIQNLGYTKSDILLSQMEKQFVAEFSKLGVYFQETFTRLFGGGYA